MMAEDENPALFKEFMAEFKATWDKCDADKDGKLNNAEFKNFAPPVAQVIRDGNLVPIEAW